MQPRCAGLVPGISIHALREEGDCGVSELVRCAGNFYPRPPRGGRPQHGRQWTTRRIFLSTTSARRATSPAPGMSCTPRNFYPRPPRGGRPEVDRQHRHREKISIHALREEGDRLHGRDRQEVHQFLSTPSARRATCVGCGRLARGAYFYPRPPRGGRRPARA